MAEKRDFSLKNKGGIKHRGWSKTPNTEKTWPVYDNFRGKALEPGKMLPNQVGWRTGSEAARTSTSRKNRPGI